MEPVIQFVRDGAAVRLSRRSSLEGSTCRRQGKSDPAVVKAGKPLKRRPRRQTVPRQGVGERLFGVSLSAIEQPRQMLLGQIPLSGPPSSNSVDQAQALIELCIGASSLRGPAVERLERCTASLAQRIRPHRHRVVVLNDEFRKRRCRVRRGQPSGNPASHGRERIADAVAKDSPVNGTSATVFRLMSDS